MSEKLIAVDWWCEDCQVTGRSEPDKAICWCCDTKDVLVTFDIIEKTYLTGDTTQLRISKQEGRGPWVWYA